MSPGVCCVAPQVGEATDIPVLKLFEFLVASICLFMIEVSAILVARAPGLMHVAPVRIKEPHWQC